MNGLRSRLDGGGEALDRVTHPLRVRRSVLEQLRERDHGHPGVLRGLLHALRLRTAGLGVGEHRGHLAGPDDLQRFEQTARESADLILRNLRRADRLVKSFKQVAVDQSSEDRRVVDLGQCLNEILTTLGPSLKKTPHTVDLVCPSGLMLETWPGVLYQIVTNLVMNSLLHGLSPDRAGTILRVLGSGDIAVGDAWVVLDPSDA